MALVSIALTGCALIGYENRVVVPPAVLFVGIEHPFQLQLCYQATGRGNIERPFDYEKWAYQGTNWLYIERSKGTLNAQDIIFAYKPEPHTGSRVSPVKGFIRFDGEDVVIELQIPYYDTVRDDRKIKGWDRYPLNGRYPVSRRDVQPLQPERFKPATCQS
jgi:hypothetical protein